MKPRLLDLFCGAGGAAKGYQRAGFYVVGVDNRPQPNYCGDEFVQADALEALSELLSGRWAPTANLVYTLGGFHGIHASPPCQAHTSLSARWRKGTGTLADARLDLIGPTRDLLEATMLPYVIENVEGARAKMGGNLVRVCGATVGLKQSRHRLFECGGWMPLVPPCGCRGREFKNVLGSKPDGRWLRRDSAGFRRNYVVSSIEEGGALMGIDWMRWRELCEAIPPAYTELIGHQLAQHIRAAAA